MKKMIVVMMTIVMLICYALPSFAISFTDVQENAWYNQYVLDLANKKIINGYPDGTFKPDNQVTLGEFLKLIVTASTEGKVNYDLVEVEDNHWAAPYLKVAKNYRVLTEEEYSIDDLDKTITRIEIVRILAKCDILIKENAQTSSRKRFLDTADLSEDDNVFLSHAVGIGVISGDTEGTFRPNDGLARSECAKVIYMYSNR